MDKRTKERSSPWDGVCAAELVALQRTNNRQTVM